MTLAADSTEDLMLTWLNELIFRSRDPPSLYRRFTVEVDESGRSLQATIAGEPIDRARHILDHEVKAATHHGLFVRALR